MFKKTTTFKKDNVLDESNNKDNKSRRFSTSSNRTNDFKNDKDKYQSSNFNNKKNLENSYKEKAAEIESNIKAKVDSDPILKATFKNLISVNKLMETGAHIGSQSRKWNPKMKQYIYIKKGNNYIIDLAQTVVLLSDAYNFLYKISKANGKALIVGTKGSIIKNHIKDESKRTNSFYINERWLGGTITNFKTISNSIKKFNSFLVMQKFGDIEKYNKKEKLEIKKETEKLAKFFGGIRMMKDLPKILIITDPDNERIAILEAKKLDIPVIAICNTNSNPDGIDYIIPANNYSIKTVYLIIGILCDAIAEANDQPKMFVGKKDEEIILPEIQKRRPEYVQIVNHSSRNFSKPKPTTN